MAIIKLCKIKGVRYNLVYLNHRKTLFVAGRIQHSVRFVSAQRVSDNRGHPGVATWVWPGLPRV